MPSDPAPPGNRPPNPSGLTPTVGLLALLLPLLVLALSLLVPTLHLRDRTRTQIVQRDAEILHAILTRRLAEDDADELTALLQVTGEKDLLALRVFGPTGEFRYSFPLAVTEAPLDPQALARANDGLPVSRFLPNVLVSSLFLSETVDEPAPSETPAPVLEILLPVHPESVAHPTAVAQLLLRGEPIAREFAALDRNLAWQTALVFLAGGSLLTLTLYWAGRRLQRANQLLNERTRTLLRANQDLALAARSSALGAVTAHLVHGIKSPLSGLHHFVQRKATGAPDSKGDTDWFHAAATTTRLQQLLENVVRVLRESDSAATYELSVAELAEWLDARLRPLAASRQIELVVECRAQGNLSNHAANLILLILENLGQNALQASPTHGQVQVRIQPLADGYEFEVEDNGPGIPEEQLPSLFSPTTSSKSGGSGIGLAISSRLASHLGATLRLKRNRPCLFALTVPAPTPAATDASLNPTADVPKAPPGPAAG